jgi:hypothetical protein
MRWIQIWGLAVIGVLAGCEKKEAPSTAGTSLVQPLPSVQPNTGSAAPIAAPAPVAAVSAVPEAKPAVVVPAATGDGIDVQTRLEGMNTALRDYCRSNDGQLPVALDDLVKAGYLPRIPAAPPGRRFELDRKANAIVLVNAR